MVIVNIENILNLINDDLNKFESELYKYVDSEIEMANEVASYTLKSGGKRLRPILLILTSHLLNFYDTRIYKIASVIEYIHTATLLHDDIIDGAKYRRGKVSANNKFGNDIVVLCGDFLYSRAFINLVEDGNSEVQMILANAAKTMSEGEIYQLVKTADFNMTIDNYLKIIHSKTAILMSACCEISAILSNKIELRPVLKKLGELIGIIFQINDDILDYLGDKKKTGKKTGTDLKEGKMTLPLILLKNNANENDLKIFKEIFFKKTINKKDLNTIVELLIKYSIKDKAYNFINSFILHSNELLAKLPSNIYNDCLQFIVSYAANRDS
jgi:octaprenyl-diphosphate synthase